MRRRLWLLAFLALVLAACAAGSAEFESPQRPANFFHGIWHGWIAPIALIWQLFDGDIRVYEPNNTGWWYDLGFYIAVISGFGSIAFRRKRPKQKPAPRQDGWVG